MPPSESARDPRRAPLLPPTLEEIRAAVAGHRAARSDFRAGIPRASVALVLAGEAADPLLAFIRRADWDGDPWSGHMALPGGRADPGDPDAEAVAERETEEEVGIALRREHLIAPLDEMPVYRAAVDTGIVLSPFLYQIGPEPPRFRLSHEVARAFWIPLGHLLDPAQATRLTLEREGRRYHYPAIAYDGELIWGLTYRVLVAFFRTLGRALPMPP